MGTLLIVKGFREQPPEIEQQTEDEREPDMDQQMQFETANEAVKALLASSEYVSADFEDKKRLADDLLLLLYENQMIREYQYWEEDRFYSYVCADGSLGGISLSEDPYTSPSGEPIN